MDKRKCAATTDTLVMGAAVGYSVHQIAPFVRSLRDVGYRGDLVLVVDARLAREVRSMPELRSVKLVTVPQWFPWKYQLTARARVMKWLVRPLLFMFWALIRALMYVPLSRRLRLPLQFMLARYSLPSTETRYLHYLKFLHGHVYQRVLISDVRDVLFQSNPFEQMPLQGLAVGIETRAYTLASEPWNAWALTLAYGPSVLHQIGHQPVSCCGVTYGTYPAMLSYLESMADEILKLNFRATLQPLDQALHNFLLWTRLTPPFLCLEALASPLVTISGLAETQLKFDSQNRLLNLDGSVIHIIHQYDRLPTISQRLLAALAA